MRRKCPTCLGIGIINREGPRLCPNCYGGKFMLNGRPAPRDEFNVGKAERIAWPQCHVNWPGEDAARDASRINQF